MAYSAGIAHQNGPLRPAFTSQPVARAALAREWAFSVRGDGPTVGRLLALCKNFAKFLSKFPLLVGTAKFREISVTFGLK